MARLSEQGGLYRRSIQHNAVAGFLLARSPHLRSVLKKLSHGRSRFNTPEAYQQMVLKYRQAGASQIFLC